MRLLVAALAATFLIAAASAPEAVTEHGKVRGVQNGNALIFRGIPFAAPPVGERRWRAPAPAEGWSGVRDATKAAPACIQNDQGWNRHDFLYASEDCLTLDVGTPGLAGRRPVIVWIHGGSNRAGSPGDMVTSTMTEQGVVLVAIRYRLGIFGFLPHRALSREAGGASGNYALMDQVAALRWVRRNIARFGGDPDNVTIAGESAGSQDVSLMLATPLARDLVDKGIMESGTPGFGLPFRSLEEGHRLGDQLDALLGTGGDLAKLRAVSTPALLAADLKLHDEALEADDYLWVRATIDGAVLPRSPRDLLAEAPPRPVIVGSNRFELDLPAGRPHRDAFVTRSFGANEARARAYYRLDEPDPAPDSRLGTRDQQIATDVTFRCPAGALAQLLAGSGAPVWRYEFDVAPDGGLTRHSIEIGYAFGGDRFAQGLSLQPYWVQFARTGNPNAPSLPAWPRFTSGEQAHISFENDGVRTGRALRAEPCSLLERL